jgi:hypothetical protein
MGYCRVLGLGGLDPLPLVPPPLLLPLPPLGGLLLPLSLGGVGLFSVGGGLLFVGGGGVDCVGQLALVSITKPSGHVFVVGGVNGCSVCVHDGSFGFILQSTGGGVPVVQLPAAHVVPFPTDPATVMLSFVMLIGVIVVLVFGITANVFVADPDLPSADACTSTLNFPGVASPLILHRCEYMPWSFVAPVRGS